MVALADIWSAIEVRSVINHANGIVSPAFNAISGGWCFFPAPYSYRGRNANLRRRKHQCHGQTPRLSPKDSSKQCYARRKLGPSGFAGD
ncbi:hypothetical protein AVEN_184207-1 [Araneus ventricosus]|uniref:Uncharacterized protein n=1 Tax=Araneus ventricosus TaxID=182803 RepID=A0A4Y2IPA5_ARAVE|nr:hypothetical protein AVEN_184207-1 [Araneus ventricosus]